MTKPTQQQIKTLRMIAEGLENNPAAKSKKKKGAKKNESTSL